MFSKFLGSVQGKLESFIYDTPQVIAFENGKKKKKNKQLKIKHHIF